MAAQYLPSAPYGHTARLSQADMTRITATWRRVIARANPSGALPFHRRMCTPTHAEPSSRGLLPKAECAVAPAGCRCQMAPKKDAPTGGEEPVRARARNLTTARSSSPYHSKR